MLGFLALVLATYRLGSYAFGERGGFYSGLALVTSIGPYIFTRFLIPDVMVGLWLALSYYFFLRSLEEDPPRRLTCWGFAAVCALNVLTKGLIGLVFPIGTIGLYLLLTRNLRHLAKLRILSSTVVFFLLAAPWHILAAIRNPAQGQARGFLWFYFVNEHIMRFLNKRVPPGYDTVPLVLFWVLLLLWLVPWAVFLPQALHDVSAAVETTGQAHGSQATSEPALLPLGAGDSAFLQLLDTAGVLHNSSSARHCAVGGRMARP